MQLKSKPGPPPRRSSVSVSSRQMSEYTGSGTGIDGGDPFPPSLAAAQKSHEENSELTNATCSCECHARVGGATGTRLTPQECLPSTSGINHGCNAGSLTMHITSQSSGHLENMWLWVADHMMGEDYSSSW